MRSTAFFSNDALGDRQQISGVAGKTVGVERQQFVRGFEQPQRRLKLIAPVERRSVARVGEHHHRAQLLQHGLLAGDILPLI